MVKRQKTKNKEGGHFRESIAFLSILVMMLLFLNSTDFTLTGFFTATVMETYIDPISESFNETAVYNWTPAEQGRLQSLKISGKVSQEGSARVLLRYQNNSYIVFDSQSLNASSAGNLITGLTTSELPDGQNQTQTVNSPPEWIAVDDSLIITQRITLELSNYFVDPDGDELAFSTNNVSSLATSITNGILTITPKEGIAATKLLTIAAFDGTDISFGTLEIAIDTETIFDEIEINEINNNESSADESFLNESVGNESLSNESAINETEINQTITNETLINQSIGNETETNITGEKTITGVLDYGDGPFYDADNNGIETKQGVVDFTLKGSAFSWDAENDKICSRYAVTALDSQETTFLCYGSAECCSFAGLEQSKQNWNDSLYLYYGLYGFSEKYDVSAQVLYVDYNLSVENPYSDIAYSGWQNNSALFAEGMIAFTLQCDETCILSDFNGTSYELIVELENATLDIDTITYTMEQETNESALMLYQNITNITLYQNTNFTINLSQYFTEIEDVEFSYYDKIEGIIMTFDDGLATIMPEKDFIGSEYTYLSAKDEDDKVISNVFAINVIEKKIPELEQLPAEIGKPVQWIRHYKANGTQAGIAINITADAINFTVRKIDNGLETEIQKTSIKIRKNNTVFDSQNYLDKRKEQYLKSELTREKKDGARKELQKELQKFARKKGSLQVVEELPAADGNITLEINDAISEAVVEYYTEAPQLEVISNETKRKKLLISSRVHYENVTAYMDVPELREDAIALFRTTDGVSENVKILEYIDANNNSHIDHIKWIVPHLSNQTYDLIIKITAAQHLDDNRNFISDIYPYVKEQDYNWSEPILENEFIRVTFEEALTDRNDITVYVRNNESLNNNQTSISIEVYYFNSSSIITSYEKITEEKYYKIYLTGLNASYDTFDLKIVNYNSDANGTAYLEFDHIVDPAAAPRFIARRPYNMSVVQAYNDSHVILNVSIYDPDNSTVDVYFYGSENETQLQEGNNSLLAIFKNRAMSSAGLNLTYNWTSPLVHPDTARNGTNGTVLILHFDNRSEFGENNSKVYDFSGNANNATCNINPCPFFNTTNYKFGTAIEFNGTNFLNVSNSSTIDVTGPEITVAGWFYMKGNMNGSSSWTAIRKGDQQYLLEPGDNGENNWTFGVALNTNEFLSVNTSTAVSIQTWHHIVGSFNGSTASIYVDGLIRNATTIPGAARTIQSRSKDLLIGKNGTQIFNGTIDELAIWNRSLSASEIADLYRLGNKSFYWKVNVSDGVLTRDNGTYTFEVGQELINLTIGVRTLKTIYGPSEIVNLTDPPDIDLSAHNMEVQPETTTKTSETNNKKDTIIKYFKFIRFNTQNYNKENSFYENSNNINFDTKENNINELNYNNFNDKKSNTDNSNTNDFNTKNPINKLTSLSIYSDINNHNENNQKINGKISISNIKTTFFGSAWSSFLVLALVSLLLTISIAGTSPGRNAIDLIGLFAVIFILMLPFMFAISSGTGDGYKWTIGNIPLTSDHNANGSGYNMTFQLIDASVGQANASQYNLSVGIIGIFDRRGSAIYSNFDGRTTNFAAEANINSVCNAVLENSSSGKIEWKNCINAEDKDFNQYVGLQKGYTIVNSNALGSSINSSANITLYNLTNIGYPLVLKDGQVCTDCAILSWNDISKNVTFNTSSFSNLSIAEGNQSKIQSHKGSNVVFWLLMKTQFYNDSNKNWIDSYVVINDSQPRGVLKNTTLKLDAIFNGLFNTSKHARHGTGLYRIYAAAQYENYSVMQTADNKNITAWFNFTINITNYVSVNSIYSVPTYPRYGQNVTLFVDAIGGNVTNVTFNVKNPSGTSIFANALGQKNNFLWNITFNASIYGTWEWNASVYDQSGIITNTSTQYIILMELNMTLNKTLMDAASNEMLRIYGRINLSNRTNVSNTSVGIFVDDQVFSLQQADTLSSDFSQGTLLNVSFYGTGVNTNLTLKRNGTNEYPNATGNFTSRIMDAGSIVNWTTIEWTNITPVNASVAIFTRLANDTAAWTNWLLHTSSGSILDSKARYAQYLAKFNTTNSTVSAKVLDVALNFTTFVTDSDGHYNVTFNAYSPGTYTIKLNTTWQDTIPGERSVSLSVTQVPSITSTNNVPTYPRKDQNTTLIATASDNNLASIRFTLENPGGTKVLDNQIGDSNSAHWNTTYNLTSYGTWKWNVSVYDNDGFIVNSSTQQIILMELNATLNDTNVRTDIIDSLRIYGHINLSNNTNVTQTRLYVYVNDTDATHDNFTDTTHHDFNNGTMINVSVYGSGADANLTLKRNESGGYPNATGNFTSRIFDAGGIVNWTTISWQQEVPYQQEIGRAFNDSNNASLPSLNTSGLVMLFHFNNESNFGENSSLVYDYSVAVNSERYGRKHHNGTMLHLTTYNYSNKKFGEAGMEFNGSRYVNISTDIPFPNGTFSVWVYPRSRSSKMMFVWGGDLAGNGYGNHQEIHLGTGNTVYESFTFYVGADIEANSALCGGINFTAGRWYHVVGVYNAQQPSCELYVDGVQISTDTTGTVLTGSTFSGSTLLGRPGDITAAFRYFNGTMDEVAIWNRSLSNNEIVNLYKRGALQLNISTRTSNDTSVWSTWSQTYSNETYSAINNTLGRYLQYKASLSTESGNFTPVLNNVTVIFNGSFTDNFGNYNFTFNSPATPGTYTIKINSTYSGTIPGERFVTLSVAQLPVIGPLNTSPLYPRKDQNVTLIASAIDNNLASIRFTLTNPAGTNIFSDQIGDNLGNNWNTTYNLTSYGTWKWNVSAYDSDGFIVNSTTQLIILMELNATLNDTNVRTDIIDSLRIYGHINLSNNTNVSDTIVRIYMNDTDKTTGNFTETSNTEFSAGTAINTSIIGTGATTNITLNKSNSTGFTDDITGGQNYESSSNESGSTPPSNAFDGSTTTANSWRAKVPEHGAGANGVSYLRVEFSSAKAIRRINVFQGNDESTNLRYVTSILFQYSDNNLSWTTAATHSSLIANTWLILNNSEVGQHIYWRVKANSDVQSADTWIINEMEMMENAYAIKGNFTSANIDANATVSWSEIKWNNETPVNTNLTIYVRTSNDTLSYSTWSQQSKNSTITQTAPGRYLQYLAVLNTSNNATTPKLLDIYVSYSGVFTDNFGNYNFTFNSPTTKGTYTIKINSTWNSIIPGERTVTLEARDNTCTCPTSGDWNGLFEDFCVITTACDMNGNDVIITGSGEWQIAAGGKILNFNRLITHQGTLTCRNTNGCFE